MLYACNDFDLWLDKFILRVLVEVKVRNCTSEDKLIKNSYMPSSTQQCHRSLPQPRALPLDDRKPTNVEVSSRPRPVRQSTGGRLLPALHGTTPPRPGNETTADGGLPTEAGSKQPTRRASAPCTTSSTPTVSIHSMPDDRITVNPFNARCSKLLLLEGFSAILV